MTLGLPHFRLSPWVAALEAVSDLGLSPTPPGGTTDPYTNTKTWASAPGVVTDSADPNAVYEALVSGSAPLGVKTIKPMWAGVPWTTDALIGASTFGAAYLSGGASLITQAGEIAAQEAGLDEQTVQYAKLGASLAGSYYSAGGLMWDDFSFDGITDFFSDFVSEIDYGELVDVGTSLYSSYMQPVANRGGTPSRPLPAPVPGTGQGGILGGMLRTPATVGRGFFNKFPNLATGIQKMRNAGHNISRSKLYGMMKRFGPEFLVTAGILTAGAVSELIMAGPGHRRMNVGNVKALRRGMRRIESFHKLCTKADYLRSRGRRRKC